MCHDFWLYPSAFQKFFLLFVGESQIKESLSVKIFIIVLGGEWGKLVLY